MAATHDSTHRTSSDSDSDGSADRGAALNLSRYDSEPRAVAMSAFAASPVSQEIEEGIDSVGPLAGSLPREGPNNGYVSSASSGSPYPPMTPFTPASSVTSSMGRAQQNATRQRGASGSDLAPVDMQTSGSPAMPTERFERPAYSRTPSHTYKPLRRPSQYPAIASSPRHRSSSSKAQRLNPDADYRAQKKAYAQRLQRDNTEDESLFSPENYPPALSYSSGTETEEDSPSAADYLENDPYDQETMLYYGNEDISPSEEELKIPANRERLEWHSMLANVLTGDVVRQEKKRLTGASDVPGDKSLVGEIWAGVRAKACGRPLLAQKRMLDDQRIKIAAWIEQIITFEIQGEAEVGKSAKQQVEEIVNLIEKCERLYPTRNLFKLAHPRADSQAFNTSCDALVSWHNTIALINTELEVLHAWVGNEQLDFLKPRERDESDQSLQDDSAFIDRILKEDGLKSLQGEPEKKEEGEKSTRKHPNILQTVNAVIEKAKATLIDNATVFSHKHLPPYIEELLTLINFPSRLIQEIIRVRLSYATKIRDPDKQGLMMAEQMISQFQILLTLAVKIKSDYLMQASPEPGWDLPPCIDENFDDTVIEALKFYFKMLGWKLSANRNSFKEAEILEQEWGFANALGRHFEGGDVEVAEQFSALTSRSLWRLTNYFEKELQRRPNEVAGAEMDRRYKSILDSVRVRQRKLFRFSRLLTQQFETATEYSISMPQHQFQEIYDNMAYTEHMLVNAATSLEENVLIFASPTLAGKSREIEEFLGTCYRPGEGVEDPSNYLVIMYPESQIAWEGPRQEIYRKLPVFGLKAGKLRVIAEGSQHTLSSARSTFLRAIGVDLDMVNPQRANLPRVDHQLQRIKKTAYKLSNTIMDSVEIIRKQLVGLECQELIQNCFAFATEFGQRSVLYMDFNRRQLNNLKLTRLALDWVAFIADDCIASDRKTFRWAVVALEFAMLMTRGQNILSISDKEYTKLRLKVAGSMSLLISHFDIMGARSTVAAQAEKQRLMEATGGRFRLDVTKMKDDEEAARMVSEQRMQQLESVDEARKSKEAERQALGHVLEESNDADRSLTFLSSSATNVQLRWQQGQFIGGGTFGSVYIGHNLDSGQLMAVKEIRLQDPQLIPTIAQQIREEMGVLQILEHPNMVKYHGIEVHRDKVFIFMDYCAGGSLAALLEHGRIEDESFTLVYTLQMLEGLAYLHESGVVHRDIKPENILLDHNGVIKFVDFGAARVIAQQNRTLAHHDQPPGAAGRQGRQRSMTGTPMYMSPEMINPDSLDDTSGKSNGSGTRTPPRPGAVDIWSLGCVVLEMVTGRRPWASLDNEWAIMYNIAQGNPPQMPAKEQMTDAGIDFLQRCFARDPVKRASAAELLQHEWIMGLRDQLSLDTSNVQASGSESGSNGVTPTSEKSSRSNTGLSEA